MSGSKRAPGLYPHSALSIFIIEPAVEPASKRGVNGGLRVLPALVKLGHIAAFREPHFAVERIDFDGLTSNDHCFCTQRQHRPLTLRH
jgi:hypothetical protein